MKEKNEIIQKEVSEISQNDKIIIKIGENIENEKVQELNEENLYYFFFSKELYNEKGTKLLNKEKYIPFLNILNEYIKEKNDFILLFFKKIDINLIKVVFNGYLTSDINDTQKKATLLDIIKNIIPLFFSKNLFYFVYNKLSKIFRQFHTIKDKEILFDKFCKLFDIWNLLYNIKDKTKVNSDYFAIIGNKELLLMKNSNENQYNYNNVDIFIEFEDGIYGLNNVNKDCVLVKVSYVLDGAKMLNFEELQNDMEENNENEKKNEINNIVIRIDEKSIGYIINEDYDSDEIDIQKLKIIKQTDNPSDFAQVEILKNYIGKIRKIKIKSEFKNEKEQNYECEILPKDNQFGYEIKEYSKKEGIIGISYELRDINKLIIAKMHQDLLYEDIRYYGGMECFIPLIKIIKYFISEFKEDENKMKILNQLLVNIIKNIVRFIFYSKNNFQNFKKILIALIGAFAEINHIYPKDKLNSLYSHYIFTILYIIIFASSTSYAIKKSYKKITGLYNIDNLNLNFEELLIDVNEINTNSYKWCAKMLIIITEFILLKYNTKEKIPPNVINQLSLLEKLVEKDELKQTKISLAINFFIQCINFIFKFETKENNLEKDLSDFFLNNINSSKETRDNIKFVLMMIQVYYNIINFDSYWYKLDEEKSGKKESTSEVKDENININYQTIFTILFNNFEKISFDNDIPIQKIIINKLEDFIDNKESLMKLFPFLIPNNFKQEPELILSELTDFHREYHNIMKNVFVFNKFWSDKNLFFNEEKKQKYLKYKSINYYTKNYQRPFIYPDLDYKYSYPLFSNFNINNNFYIEEENPDDYNFSLECPEFDTFIIEYEQKIIKLLKNKSRINLYNVCMVKRSHHIKGIMIVYNDNSSLIKKICFYSYPEKKAENIPCCNNFEENEQNNSNNNNKKKIKLCYGAIFPCPKKNMNMKISIPIDDVRMILKKIYFYRKSAVEIYTTNKSYFFNFAEKRQGEKNCENFTNMFGFFIPKFYPIGISKEIIGHSRQFEAVLKSYKKKEKNFDISIESNKFISSLFEHWNSNDPEVEFSTLDLLIYLNLLSNRSYIDLFQYPVFPVLFFYDKVKGKENTYNKLERKLNQHIGFQEVSDKSKFRKNLIQHSYIDSKKEYDELEEEETEEEDEKKGKLEKPSYFKTHFSNNFYVSNFLIRIFPFSFLAIELQGNGFDSPNRLFFSIEDSFYNISFHKSDLRELIPEFYYFPEMMWNINKINFGTRANGLLVDGVEIPKDLDKLDKDKGRSSITSIDDSEKSDYYGSFRFIEKMRNLLESRHTDIISWINIIFGPGQKYKNIKKEDLYFREESYIDYSDKNKKLIYLYSKSKSSMTCVEFGITPIQTVLATDLGKAKNKNKIYDLTVKENKEYYKKICKEYKINPGKNKEINNIKNINNKEQINYKIIKITSNSKTCYKIFRANKAEKICTKENRLPNNNIYINPKLYIKYILEKENIKIIGYKTGKVKIYKKNEEDCFDLVSEFFDHHDEINYINYNQRLNVFCTCSKDGFLNVYSLPNKLITTIKNENKNYFGLAFLSSNPFPSIIALELETLDIYSYTINGFKIKKSNIFSLLGLNSENKTKDIWVGSHFNEAGGTFKDKLIFIETYAKDKDYINNYHLIMVPFFDKEEKPIEIKIK